MRTWLRHASHQRQHSTPPGPGPSASAAAQKFTISKHSATPVPQPVPVASPDSEAHIYRWAAGRPGICPHMFEWAFESGPVHVCMGIAVGRPDVQRQGRPTRLGLETQASVTRSRQPPSQRLPFYPASSCGPEALLAPNGRWLIGSHVVASPRCPAPCGPRLIRVTVRVAEWQVTSRLNRPWTTRRPACRPRAETSSRRKPKPG